jgi:hypothetical protein
VQDPDVNVDCAPFDKPALADVPQPATATVTEVASNPRPFLNTTSTVAVPTLKSIHTIPAGNVHLLGRNLSGLKAPKYAIAPIATKTTKVAQP